MALGRMGGRGIPSLLAFREQEGTEDAAVLFFVFHLFGLLASLGSFVSLFFFLTCIFTRSLFLTLHLRRAMGITLALAIFSRFASFSFTSLSLAFIWKQSRHFFLYVLLLIVLSCWNGVGNVVCNISTGTQTGLSAI